MLSTAEPTQRKSILWPTTRGRDVSKRNHEGIRDRFQRDPACRESQVKIGWTEEQCIAMDKLAQEDHSYRLSSEEYERYQKNWYLTLNESGRNAPMKLRSDFREAVTIMNRLHRKSGEERPERILFHQYQRWHPSSSSNSSWWQWEKTGGTHIFQICCSRIVYS